MRRRSRIFSLVLGLLALTLVACGAPETAPPTGTEEARSTPTPMEETEPTEVTEPEATDTEEPEESEEPEEEMPAWEADATIGEDEYTDSADFGQMKVWWRHDGEFLYLAMEGQTEGWIAIGIEPTNAMQDADFLLGFVDEGEAQIWDAYGTAPAGANHPPDEELGGTRDIEAFAGTEADGMTRFELQIPLDSGDEYDKALSPGENYNIIVAMGTGDTYNAGHFFVSSGTLALQP